jgi:hypothetical protein
MNIILFTLITILILLNVIVSVLVIRASAFSSTQKAYQIILIWLVPFLGASICLYFVRESTKVTATIDQEFTAKSNRNDTGYG